MVEIADRSILQHGIFTYAAEGIQEGQRYAFSLDGGRDLPDPASRWQHILSAIKRTANTVARDRNYPIHVIAESCLNEVHLLHPPDRGGYGLDAQWSDAFHHAVHALVTGEQDGYYGHFHAPTTQVAKAINDTFVYDSCYSVSRGRRHGRPVGDLSGDRFVVSLQTHDRIGKRAKGERLSNLLQPAKLRLATSLFLLSPFIPLLFMGEEYGEEHPFPFFCDFGDPRLQDAVRTGRRAEAWFNLSSSAIHAPFDRLVYEIRLRTVATCYGGSDSDAFSMHDVLALFEWIVLQSLKE